MALSLRLAAQSHVGLVRDGNEDSGYAGHRLLVVADGMGGHVAGEVASSVAVTTLSALDDPPGPDSGVAKGETPAFARPAASGDLLTSLREAVEAANEQLRLLVGGDPALRGMGTTLTALLHVDGRLGVAHVGDSRCYLLRNGELSQITADHTFVQTLVDEGRITAEDAETHPQRSLLTRALDGREDVEPDLSLREAKLGDRYLLCSDGLSGVVRDTTLRDTLMAQSDAGEACAVLVDLALRAGGPDNITCVVADVVDDVLPTAGVISVGAAARTPEEAEAAPPVRTAPRRRPQPARGERADATPRVSAAPPPRPRRRLVQIGALAVVVLALLLAGSYGAYALTQRQFYVGSDDSYVAIYRGVPGSFLGIPLSQVEQRSALPLQGLPELDRTQVGNRIPANDLADAQRILNNLRERARRCEPAPASPETLSVETPSPRPSRTPTSRPLPTPVRSPVAADDELQEPVLEPCVEAPR